MFDLNLRWIGKADRFWQSIAPIFAGRDELHLHAIDRVAKRFAGACEWRSISTAHQPLMNTVETFRRGQEVDVVGESVETGRNEGHSADDCVRNPLFFEFLCDAFHCQMHFSALHEEFTPFTKGPSECARHTTI